MARKFAKVAKNARGTPLKYLEGLSPSEKKAKEAEMKRTAKKAKAGTLTKAEMDRISKEREARGMKKGGAAKKSSGTPACVKKHAKSSGMSTSKLNKVYKRGLGAYYSSGSRNVSAGAWACGRVKSFATGKGGARKADSDLLKKNTGGEVSSFDAKKSDLNKDGKISKYERKRGEAIASSMSKQGDSKMYGKKKMKNGGNVMKMKDGGSCGGMRDVGAVKMAMGGSAVAGPSAKKVQGPSNRPCGLYGRK